MVLCTGCIMKKIVIKPKIGKRFVSDKLNREALFLGTCYILVSAIFIFPIHWSLFLIVLLTSFLYGFWDQSVIKLGFNLPFHGSNKFHDDHHKYFHVNFGFLTPFFDILHDTARREGHRYREDTFTGGKGDVDIQELGNKAIGPSINYGKTKK